MQSINEAEYREIGRINSIEKLRSSLRKLNENHISYEASIIYGLPKQTVSTFSNTINFLDQQNCTTLYAYPLMLLRGTELYAKKDKLELKEEIIAPYNIPVVTQSKSFTRNEWEQMHFIAQNLGNSLGKQKRVL